MRSLSRLPFRVSDAWPPIFGARVAAVHMRKTGVQPVPQSPFLPLFSPSCFSPFCFSLSLYHHSRSIFVFFHSSLIQLELSVFTPTWSCSLLELSHRYILPPNPYFSIPLLIRHNEVFPLRPRSGSCSCSVRGSNHQLLRRFQPGCVSLSLPAESGCS